MESTVEEVLDMAALIERKVAGIYRSFKKSFGSDVMAGYLWESLANEEDGHAEFLEAQKKLVKTSGRAVVMINISVLRESLEAVEKYEKLMEKGGLTNKDAVRIALDIENSMLEKNHNILVGTDSPVLTKIFKQFSDTTAHIEKLRVAAEKLGVGVPAPSGAGRAEGLL
ncbi:MAG: hypothetical protein WA162_02685 [Thermodesulfobacteriota bacterium]